MMLEGEDGMMTAHNNTDSEEEEEFELKRWEHTIIGIYLLTLGIISTTGNGLVATILLSNKKLRSTLNNLLLLNMAISDLGVSILGFPFTTASSFHGRWLFGDLGCSIEAFSVTTFCLTDINILLALSIVRYILVCKPQHHHILARTETKVLTLVSVWGWSLIWTIPPFFGWSSYTHEPFKTSCSVKWDGVSISDNTYNFGLIIFEYLIHGVIMIYCYYHVMRTSTRTLRSLQRSKSPDDAASASKCKEDLKVNVMILLMVVVYNVVWAPYTWLSLVVIISPGALPKSAFTFPTMFAKLSSASNPLVYGLTNPQFRTAVGQKIKQWRDRSQVACEPARQNPPREMTKDGIYIGTDEVF